MKPRRRDRRKRVAVCQRCAGALRLVGQPGIGVQILKCAECGNMDRRLPIERRAAGGEVLSFWTRARVVVALELVALAAVVAAVAIAFVRTP